MQDSDWYRGPFYSGHNSNRRVCMSGLQEWAGKRWVGQGCDEAFVLSESSFGE